MLDLNFEKQFIDNGYSIISGTDEAGRGPLAGPVSAAAVILPEGLVIEGLNDSKKLSEKKREYLFDVIKESAVSYSIQFATVEEIDSLNILNAAQLAMRRAVAELNPSPDLVLVDGNIARDFTIKAVPVIGGDAKSQSIAAASVLAKVARDRILVELDEKYPEYGFAKHKGYPTKDHMNAIRTYGVLPIHRKTFLKFLDKDNS